MAEPQAGAGAVVGIEPVDVALDVGVLRHDLGHEAGKFQRRKTRDRGGVELVVLALLCEQLAKGPVSAITVGTDQQQAGIRSERLRSEEHTSELQSLMRISYAVFCLKKKNKKQK